MVNMAASLLILVEMTIGAPTPHTRMDVSLLLLELTEPIGNPLLVR